MAGSRKLPTREELRTWREFIETTEALRATLGARLHSDTGLSTGDYAVLLALSEADDTRLRSSELAASVGWERSRLSHHLGRMERRGLIRREECAADSRGAEIVLEPGGSEAFQAATYPHLRAVRELFVDALTPDQLAVAGDIAAALRGHLDQDSSSRATTRRGATARTTGEG
jgi:DNA-binding MarR family transcriptional regulator